MSDFTEKNDTLNVVSDDLVIMFQIEIFFVASVGVTAKTFADINSKFFYFALL